MANTETATALGLHCSQTVAERTDSKGQSRIPQELGIAAKLVKYTSADAVGRTRIWAETNSQSEGRGFESHFPVQTNKIKVSTDFGLLKSPEKTDGQSIVTARQPPTRVGGLGSLSRGGDAKRANQCFTAALSLMALAIIRTSATAAPATMPTSSEPLPPSGAT